MTLSLKYSLVDKYKSYLVDKQLKLFLLNKIEGNVKNKNAYDSKFYI